MSVTADNSLAGAPAASDHRAYFVSPLVDFLCLGGASLIVLPIMALVIPAEPFQPTVTLVMLALTNIINHPHFAHSYQIFYRDFTRKAFGQETTAVLRARYIFAGIIVPVLLFAFFAVSIGLGDARMLGLGMNLVLFLVGWHYVKQGYGMAIVDSVFKRLFFSNQTKKLMLLNGYACWALGWIIVNREAAQNDFWGVAYFMFEIPDILFTSAIACAAVTSVLTLIALFKEWRKNEGRIPVNGVLAYLTTLYLWIIFVHVNPLFILVVPAFHSLQYLLVVWRFQLNAEHGQSDARDYPNSKWLGQLTPNKATMRFTLFLAMGIVLGFMAFWAIPFLASALTSFDPLVFGVTPFFFICWIFVNVHHYCLDNVMWRRENPDTKKYLFS